VNWLDTDHPFFRPLWIRVAVVAVCFTWAFLEWLVGSPLWGVIAFGVGAYAAWAFFIAFNPRDPDETRQKQE
jgi:hypothetical protein